MELAAFAYMSCMKRRILTATIIAAMAIATQQAVAGSLVEVELAKASGSKTPNTLTLKTDGGVVRTFLEITQDESKRIELKAPPFASIDVSGVLYIGELAAKGLFALMLDSFNGPIPYKGFGKNGNISIPSNLSLAPKLSGMALCAENLDVVALNPVFNPNSPMGFGFVLGTNVHSFRSLQQLRTAFLCSRQLQSCRSIGSTLDMEGTCSSLWWERRSEETSLLLAWRDPFSFRTHGTSFLEEEQALEWEQNLNLET